MVRNIQKDPHFVEELESILRTSEGAAAHTLVCQVRRLDLPATDADQVLKVVKPLSLANYLEERVLHLLAVVRLPALRDRTPPLLI